MEDSTKMEQLSTKLQKILSQKMWYHGTILSHWDSFCENGVVVDINLKKSDILDFGYGFYMTISSKAAENYIKRLCTANGLFKEGEEPLILGYEFNALNQFNNSTVASRIFEKYDEDFAVFVFNNRIENVNGNNQHNYHIIYGVMSDSDPINAMLDYETGKKTKQEVLEVLKKTTSMKQLSLHTQELCDILILKEAYTFNIETGERKELM